MDELLDTTAREASITPGEAEMLPFALDRSRAQFAWKVGGNLLRESIDGRVGEDPPQP